MPVTQFTIGNGNNIPLNLQQGTVPNVQGTLFDWFQVLTFGQITKTTVGFQVVETVTDINFWGLVQPLSERALLIKPEGQRAWSWLQLFVQSAPNGAIVSLNVDDVIIYNGKQTRVMGRTDFAIYGYSIFSLVQDYISSGPPTP